MERIDFARVEPQAGIPECVASDPALLFLHGKIEQMLGIKAAGDSLARLNSHIERSCGFSFAENPSAYEDVFASRVRNYEKPKPVIVNETHFFRESAHFDILSRNLLPRIATLSRPLRVCSAATSIGCEAYSIAMMLEHLKAGGLDFEFEVDAFDSCAQSIKKAKAGRYGADSVRPEASAWKHVMDMYLAPNGHEHVVSRAIRERVRFFPHDILSEATRNAPLGEEKKYDIIFCRDALIYFPNGNRRAAMNALAELLLDEGLLFLGFSETSGASHPQLASRYSSGVFYFQKIPRGEMQAASDQMPHGIEPSAAPDAKAGKYKAHLARALRPKQLKALELCQEISAFMLDNGGKPNAQKTLKAIANDKMGRKNLHPPSDAELAAAALYFLGARNSSCANIALEYFHRCCSGTFPVFLRGEYHLLLGNAEASVNCFRRAFALDNSFWPAPYKIALQSGGEDEGKIREALKSMDMGAALGYECLLGGFPPDHFRRILEGKLARK